MLSLWWRRWESNPRPKVFNSRIYMLIRLSFYTFCRQLKPANEPTERPASKFLNDSLPESEAVEKPANSSLDPNRGLKGPNGYGWLRS